MSGGTRQVRIHQLCGHTVAQGWQRIYARSIRHLLGIFHTVPGRRKLFFPWMASCKAVTSERSVTVFPVMCRVQVIEANTPAEYGKISIYSLYHSPSPSVCVFLTVAHTHTQPLVSLIWLTFLLALLPLCMVECICGLVNGLANSPSCLMGFCLFLSLITRKALTDSEHYLYFLWPLIYLNFATWHSSWFKIITRKEKLHVYLDAVLLYLESFFLELLPLALVKQNIMLQGSDEEWIFNELQIVLSKTLPCTTGPVCLWSLKDAWNISIFGSFLKLQLLLWNLLFPPLSTEFFLAFNTFLRLS